MTAATEAPATARNPLDVLVNATTAMTTWAELEQAMSGGYAPTIRGDTRRKLLLRKAVAAAGFSYFDGRKVHYGTRKAAR